MIVISVLDILMVRCLGDIYMMSKDSGYKYLEFEGEVQILLGRGCDIIR